MHPKLLFRVTLAEENELEIAKKYFDVIENRSDIDWNDYVIGRYSVLPYYKEFEYDVQNLGAELVNTHKQYSYVSKIENWYPDLQHLTPYTWFKLEDIPKDQPGSFVLKGNINSRKQLWKTHMFAKTRDDVITVYNRLLDDWMLPYQGIVIRQYEPLVGYGEDIVGLPITKEFRIFIYHNQVVSSGYYWSNQVENISDNLDPAQIPQDLIQEAIKIVGDKCNFWTLDVGQKQNGEWIIIEMGDAQMAGLSCNDPDTFYRNLVKLVRNQT